MANINGVNPPVINDQDYVTKIEDSFTAVDEHDHSTGKGLPIAAGGIAAGAIVNADINAAAAIARSKFANGTVDHVLINSGTGAMSSEAQLAGTRGGTGVSSTATFPASGVVTTDAGTSTLTNKTFDADGTGNSITNIENADIKAGAAIALNKLAATTVSRALVSDGSGFVSPATTTAAEIGFINGLTSAVQTQLDAKVLKSTYTAKGSILAATAASTPANLSVGADNLFLKADSSQSTGLIWASPSSAGLAITSKTANYTATTADDVILCDGTSAAFTITLYAASGNSGKKLVIKKTDTSVNAITIDGNASETIDGSTTTTLNTQNEVLVIICDGTNWQIQERRIPSTWATDTGFTVGGPTTSATSFQSRRAGDMLQVTGKITWSGAGTGAKTVAVAGSRSIDTAKLTDTTANLAGLKGACQFKDSSGSTNYTGIAVYNSTDTLRWYFETAAAGSMQAGSDTIPVAIGANDILNVWFEVPITGWKG